jgi:phospholipase/carboxylesterase
MPKGSDAEPLYFEDVPSPTRKGPLLILLHGRGADEGDLLPIVDYVARGWNAVSIRAPIQFPMGGYAWYHFLQDAGPEPHSLKEGVARLDATLGVIEEAHPSVPHVMLGFSQGALMALTVATLRRPNLAGVAALSGYLPDDALLPAPLSRLKGLSIFQSHARNDFILPFAWGEATRDRLTRAGADLTWLEHEAGHSIPLDAMDRLATWLERAASKPR